MNIVSATKCKTAIIFECIKLNHTYPSSLPGLHVASARLGISLKKFTHAKKATSNEVAAGPICGKAEKNLNVVSDCLKAQCLNIPPDISGVCLKLCGLLSQYNLLSFHNPFETARAILEYVSTIFHNNSIEKVYSRKISESGKINSLMLPVFGVLKRNEDVPLTWDLFIECLNFIEASSYRQICALIDSNSRKYRFLMNKIKSYRDEYESERYEYDNHQIKYDSHKGVIMHLIHSGYSDEDISKVDVDSICREYHVDRLSNMSEQDFDREVSLDIKTFVEKKMWSNLLH
ncbi:hypothetical protein RF11_07114 [Thelohanellus kitauei]|uniref:Uncharacterized protein n=1 Tax=Thelohanellus kitauei TaxID=669202 RepID=A0A0C2MCG9_THEKT|nr:hypothetical protein RF11_07114 [Thelohanellus kitauei]